MALLPSFLFGTSRILFLALFSLQGAWVKGDMRIVTWSNFSSLLEGEWMVEFYAPWCPACKQFASTWDDFAIEMNESSLIIAKVDVTEETMLSGRFMVTSLPSVFHIKDGEVWQYEGSWTKEALIAFINDKKWEEMDPVPMWKSPTSTHMHLVGTVFWLSEKAKEIQDMLQQDYQLPTYAVFLIIAALTIAVGLVLGGITVCFIEVCMRLCSRGSVKDTTTQKSHQQQEKLKQSSTSGGSDKFEEATEEVTLRKRKAGEK